MFVGRVENYSDAVPARKLHTAGDWGRFGSSSNLSGMARSGINKLHRDALFQA